MVRNRRNVLLAVVGVVLGGTVLTASATTLSFNMTADNEFSVYLSTDPALQGDKIALTQLGGGAGTVWVEGAPDGSNYQTNDWSATYAGTADLAAGKTYYLHVVAKNHILAGPSGLLADLSLSDTDHKFANGTKYLLSNTSSGWTVKTPLATAADGNLANQWGWATPASNRQLSLSSDLYPGEGIGSPSVNGVAPWGNHPSISSSAQWIWSDSPFTTDLQSALDLNAPRFFSATIQYASVPEATTMLFGLAAVMPLLSQRRRQRAAATPAA